MSRGGEKGRMGAALGPKYWAQSNDRKAVPFVSEFATTLGFSQDAGTSHAPHHLIPPTKGMELWRETFELVVLCRRNRVCLVRCRERSRTEPRVTQS